MLEFVIALSMHIGIGTGWNAVHPGIRYTEDQWTVGAYYNSEYTGSLYGSYTFESSPWFIEVGGATGYSGAKVVPFIRVGLELSEKTKMFIVPAYEITKKQIGFVLGIEYTF